MQQKLLGFLCVFITIWVQIFTFISCGFTEHDIEDVDIAYPWLSNLEWGSYDLPPRQKEYTVAFYHINAAHPRQIVDEQIQMMNDTGLMNELDKVLYLTVEGKKTNFSAIKGDKFKLLKDLDSGYEHDTLAYLWRFCKSSPNSKVMYFHNKASMELRAFLNCYVLNPKCLDVLGQHDTCGWRITPTPFIHYPGNFWWANCNYVNKLFDPLTLFTNESFYILTQRVHPCIAVNEHSFADAWIGSAPVLLPADCMSAAADHRYMFGHANLPLKLLPRYCPTTTENNGTVKRTFGSQCNTASTYKDAEMFKFTFEKIKTDVSYAQIQEYCKKDLDEDNKFRSMIWYGQEPVTYLSWMSKIKPQIGVPDGTPVKKDGYKNKQVWLYQNGSLHIIPDQDTYFMLGFDNWDRVVSLPDYRIEFTPIGAPIKSCCEGRRLNTRRNHRSRSSAASKSVNSFITSSGK